MAQAGATAGEAGFWRAQSELAAILALLCSLPALTAPGKRAGEVRQIGAGFNLPGDRAAPAKRLVEDAREFFRPRLAERITIAAVARHLRMSPSAFSHRYAWEAGQVPMAALADLRMELARNLLLRGLKMDAIARHTASATPSTSPRHSASAAVCRPARSAATSGETCGPERLRNNQPQRAGLRGCSQAMDLSPEQAG